MMSSWVANFDLDSVLCAFAAGPLSEVTLPGINNMYGGSHLNSIRKSSLLDPL